MKAKKRIIIRFLLWAALSFFFLLLFSYSTSPFYSISWGHDSAVFQIIGKGWKNGLIPYRDSFDHKGPLLFALNATGYLIGGKTGLFLLQGLFMLAFLEVSFRTFRLFLKESIAVILPVIMQIILCRTFDEGNMTEEWSLLFLAVSFYCLIKWLKSYRDGKKTHPPFYAFIYGICFACILFLRVTNAIGICCCVFIITVFLLKNRCFKNLLQNMASILCGVLLIVVPFCLYFYLKGCLYDMWYATILFNLFYGMENLWDMKMKISLLLWALAALSCVYWYYFKKEPASYMGLLSAVLTGFLLYHSRGYEHYYMILCTYMPLYVYMVHELQKKGKKIWTGIFVLGIAGQVGVTVLFLPQKLNRSQRMYENEALNASFSGIMEQIGDDERDSVIFYNMEAQAYLYADIQPVLKYFTHQDFHASISEKTREDVFEQFADAPPKWIVVEIDSDEKPLIENEEIKSFLLENYTMKWQEENSNRNERYGIYRY